MSQRVKVGIFLDASVVENLRSLIQEKYNKYEKGLLSYEVELALRNWLALHTQAQTTLEIKKPNPTPQVMVIFAQIKENLLHRWYYELKSGQQIPTSQLEEAIMAVRGSDKRTVRKWLRIFNRMGLIKPITSATWEIM